MDPSPHLSSALSPSLTSHHITSHHIGTSLTSPHLTLQAYGRLKSAFAATRGEGTKSSSGVLPACTLQWPMARQGGGPRPPSHKSSAGEMGGARTSSTQILSLPRVLVLKSQGLPSHAAPTPSLTHTHTPHHPSPLPLPSLAYPPYTPSHPSLKCTPPHAPGAVSAAARELRPVEIVGLYETQRVALEAELAACKAEVCGLGP